MDVHKIQVSTKDNLASNSTKIHQVLSTSDMEPTIIFMTGSTGFIGKETVKQLAQGDAQLLLLVRSEQRARTVLKAYGVKDFTRITFITGDLSISGLGLTTVDRERVVKANAIIHAGERWTLPWNER